SIKGGILESEHGAENIRTPREAEPGTEIAENCGRLSDQVLDPKMRLAFLGYGIGKFQDRDLRFKPRELWIKFGTLRVVFAVVANQSLRALQVAESCLPLRERMPYQINETGAWKRSAHGMQDRSGASLDWTSLDHKARSRLLANLPKDLV